jgi:hypothetical protein
MTRMPNAECPGQAGNLHANPAKADEQHGLAAQGFAGQRRPLAPVLLLIEFPQMLGYLQQARHDELGDKARAHPSRRGKPDAAPA